MHWGLPTVISIVAFLCYGGLLAFIVRRGLDRATVRYFTLYLLSMLVWSFGAGMMYLDPGHVGFWSKVMISGTVGMPLAFFVFIRAFLTVTVRERWLYAWLICFLVLLVANAEGYLAEHVRITERGLIEYEFGPAVPALGIYFALLIGLSGLNLIRGLIPSEDFYERNRIKYALLGLGAIVLGSLTNLVHALGAYPLDIAANIVNALLLAYAIGRYQLLDISLVIRRGLVYSIPTTIIAIGYFLVILLAERLLRPFTGYRVFVSVLVAAVTAIVFQPLRDSIQRVVDRLFFREKYNARLMLQELSELVAAILDVRELTTLLLDRLTATIHIERAYIFLRERETRRFELVAQTGPTTPEGADVFFRERHPVVRWLGTHREPLSRHDLRVLPKFRALWTAEREALDRLQAELFVPLWARDELTGILILGPKLSEAPYSRDERLTLITLANQVAVAIHNAWLYDEIVREKERTETIVEETSAGIMVLDRRMRILTMNPGAQAITGYTPTEVLGKRLPDIFGPQLGGEETSLYEAVIAGERLSPKEATLEGKDGVRDVLLGVAPLAEGSLLSFTDITRLKEVERLKTNIVANVSHELRTPLASIKAYTELLLDNVEGDDVAVRHEFLSVIDDKADRLAELISDLLDLSRLESGQFQIRKEPLSVRAVVDDVVDLVEVQAAEKDVAVRLDVPPDLPIIVADKDLMTIVVKNLVSNAVKFSHEKSRVDVAAREMDGNLVLEVVDQGIGIPPEELPNLFQKFHRLKSAKEAGTEGTGLGLVLVKEAVEAHSGDIEVESELGEGSCFRVTLPLTPPSRDSASPGRAIGEERSVAGEQ